MVTIVSEYQDGFTGANTRIACGPLYSKRILSMIDIARIAVVTRQCWRDVASLGKDEKALREAVKTAVKSGRYLCSEWCQLSTAGAWVEAAWKEMDCDFYIKFCVGKTGSVILTLSHHPHRQRH
ncbi:hypothetical protein B5M10_00750 [Pluralibacter gergoviae]|uniref:hypothetical protein n=1 Tax=Pluralibacter gergoviae TaxID=61647 RepID=UPI0005EC70F8|nr:hypothetical protein [Pluralibacter gergoviae]KJM63345.1 hypothetical protein SS31_12750 [Pluralibacter gergoviae]OUR04637.1 hypothetical protein B5M10_00750 [Pluralibacter gergoviae]